jgi:hypothetical protein
LNQLTGVTGYAIQETRTATPAVRAELFCDSMTLANKEDLKLGGLALLTMVVIFGFIAIIDRAGLDWKQVALTAVFAVSGS